MEATLKVISVKSILNKYTIQHEADVGKYPSDCHPDWGRMSFLVDFLRPTPSEGTAWYHLLKKVGGGCNDLIYSGHMLVDVLTAMEWTKAIKRKANFEESKKLRERLQALRKEDAKTNYIHA